MRHRHSIVRGRAEGLGRSPMSDFPTAPDDRRHPRRRRPHRRRRSSAPRCCIAARCREITGAEVWLKFENLQFTAAYKERGALNKLLQLTADERAPRRHRRLGRQPCPGGRLSRQAARHSGDDRHAHTDPDDEGHPDREPRRGVVLHGETFDDAYAHARELEAEQGLVFVHPFDDPAIIAGQGTVALEMLDAVPDLDVLVVPIGGGGLISGMATAAKALKPDIEIIGVEAELYPSMKNVVEGGHGAIGGDTLAEGIAVKEPGQLTRTIIADWSTDPARRRARHRARRGDAGRDRKNRRRRRGRGGACRDARPSRTLSRASKVGTVLCGGNIDTHLLANVLVRDLVRCGRIARLRIERRTAPARSPRSPPNSTNAGSTSSRSAPAHLHPAAGQGHVIEVECEARDAQAIDTLVVRLEAAGFTVERAQLD